MRLRSLIHLAATLLLTVTTAAAAGTINVNLNINGASFSIVGPANYNGGGLTSSLTGAQAGTYTITYADLPGVVTPQPETQVLLDGGSVTFNGNYTIPGSTGQINVITDLPAATFTLSGAGNYSGFGSYWLLQNAPAGTYTVTFGGVPGFPTPQSQTAVLSPNGTITITATYGVSPGNFGTIFVNTDLPGAGFTIRGTNTYSGTGTFFSRANVPAGTYTITYTAVPGYPTPPSQTLVLGPGGSINFTARYLPNSGGIINVTADLAAATFAVTGPSSFSGSGLFYTQSNRPAGLYTISFGTVDGYPTPASQTLYLGDGGLITFAGTYTSVTVPTTGAINVTTNLAEGSFVINGPNSYAGNGLNWAQSNVPAGTYTITYGAVAGYLTPAPQTQTLAVSSSLNFIGVYVPISLATGSIFVVTDLPDSSYNITGPTSYSGTGKLFAQSAVLPGTYTITYNPVSGYTTPGSQTLELKAASSITFNANYGVPASTGTIIVNSNLSSASFVITGPDYIQGSGAFFSKSSAPAGNYTITFFPFTGYATPTNQTLKLEGGGAITFNGNYGSGVSAGTINVATNMPNATFTLTGPASYSGHGLTFNQTGVPAGAYIITYGTIPNYTSPPTEVRLLPANGTLNFSGTYTLTSPLDLPVVPSSLNFAYDVGRSLPGVQKLQITAPKILILTATATSDTGWLSVTPGTSTTPSTLTVSVNPAGLAKAIYTGTITISAGSSYHVSSIPVTLTVRDPAQLILTPSNMTFTYELAGKMAPPQDLFVSASDHNVNYKIVNGSNWLTVSGVTATPAKLSVSVNPLGLTPGTYSASIAFTSDEVINSPQTTQVSLVVTGVATQLGITAVANAASGVPKLAPCSMGSVFGAFLAQSVDTAQAIPLPYLLAKSKVNVNGEAAPLFYASPGQINFQVPCDLSPGSVQLEVNNGLASTFSTAEIRPTAPGVFSTSGKWAAATNEDGSVLDGTHPAKPGSLLTVYFTGQGLLEFAIATGDPAPTNRLLRPQASADVKIGTAQADILFIGLTPGTVGVAQVNLRVPDLQDGEYPLVLTVGAAASNATTVPVKRP